MTWRARIEHDMMRDGIAVALADVYPDGNGYTHPIGVDGRGHIDWHTHYAGPEDGPDEQDAAILVRLSDDQARALLDALANHYGGSVDSRTARADLAAERARCNKLIDGLLEWAQRPQTLIIGREVNDERTT